MINILYYKYLRDTISAIIDITKRTSTDKNALFLNRTVWIQRFDGDVAIKKLAEAIITSSRLKLRL